MGNIVLKKRRSIQLEDWNHEITRRSRYRILNETREIVSYLKGLSTIAHLIDISDEKARNPAYFVQNPYAMDKNVSPIWQTMNDETRFDQTPPNCLPARSLRYQLSTDFPFFLKNYINKKNGMKLKLSPSSIPVRQSCLEIIPEAVHLLSHMKFLQLWYNDKASEEIPQIILKENHGNTYKKALRVPWTRKMIPRIIILKKTECLIVIGKGFMLRLHPPDMSIMEQADFPLQDVNDEGPVAMGTYTRLLDSVPTVTMEWNVVLWDWFNKDSNTGN